MSAPELPFVDPSMPLRKNRRASPFRFGVHVSLWFHVLLAAGLLIVPSLMWLLLGWSFAVPQDEITVVAASPREEKSDTPPVRVVTDPAEVTGNLVVDELNRVIDEAEQRSAEENVQELDELARRLEEVSTEQSLDALAAKMHEWLGTEERASQPAEEPAGGPFDFETAQVHDVVRELRDDGRWQYSCVLLDAEGRTLAVELTEAEGEQLYPLWQKIKQYPLLERVYRQMMMPLLDQMIRNAR